MTRVALVNKDNGAEPVIGELLILPQFIPHLQSCKRATEW